MSETVVVNGRTLYSPVLACRPVRFEDYPPERRKLHEAVVAESGSKLNIYPGSEYVPCEDCGIEVALGPRQQETRDMAREVGLLPHVVCMFDAAIRANEPDVDAMVTNLGNPFKRRESQ